MNLDDAKKAILLAARAGNAVLMQGASGLGKSQIAFATARQMARQNPEQRWGFGQIFLATQTPPDLIGYQFKGERKIDMGNGEVKTFTVTDPSAPLWYQFAEFDPKTDNFTGRLLPAFCFDKCFLLIDEYGQGEADTKKAAAEIMLNGGTPPWYLPPGSIRVGASNVGSRYGVTKDFDFAIARRKQIDIRGDVKVWLAYADKGYPMNGRTWSVMPVVKAWAAQHPEILFEEEPKEQGPWCNPRTLCAVDRELSLIAEDNKGEIPTADSWVTEMVAGTIGMPATVSLMGHLTFRLQLPPYEDVVKNPAGTPLPSKADLQMLMAYELAARVNPDDLGAVIKYVDRMPKDMAITFVSAAVRRDYRGLISAPGMDAWVNKNAALIGIISSLSHQ